MFQFFKHCNGVTHELISIDLLVQKANNLQVDLQGWDSARQLMKSLSYVTIRILSTIWQHWVGTGKSTDVGCERRNTIFGTRELEQLVNNLPSPFLRSGCDTSDQGMMLPKVYSKRNTASLFFC